MLPALLRGAFRSSAALAVLPLRAAAPAATSKKASRGDKGPRRTGKLSHEVATGCSLLKGETDPPLKPDDQYPDWLFKLIEPAPSSKELLKAYEETGLSLDEMKRLWRLQNKARIVEENILSKK